MPSIHIPESVFSSYVDQEGGYDEAKDAIKAAVKEGLDG